jgi:hypothetical protein
MYIEGWAFKENKTEISKANYERYKEIEHLRGELQLSKQPAYGKGNFSGVLNESTRHLTEKDLALIADDGNLCFGGTCTISGDRFSGSYYTD